MSMFMRRSAASCPSLVVDFLAFVPGLHYHTGLCQYCVHCNDGYDLRSVQQLKYSTVHPHIQKCISLLFQVAMHIRPEYRSQVLAEVPSNDFWRMFPRHSCQAAKLRPSRWRGDAGG